jgi:beta-barrel assembly-enhancing protease
VRLFRRLLLIGVMLSVAAAPAEQLRNGPGYVPTDTDERGMWMQAEEYERELKNSSFVMHDPALNAYVRSVFCKTIGQAECKDVRIYLIRTPFFNANMSINGVMQVYSGLFLRTRNEAQLAAILGHEYVHYRNRHLLLFLRDAKKKLSATAWLGAFGGYGALLQLGILGSIFTYSREMEAESDAGAIPLMYKAGYDPRAASAVWEQLRAEMDATALARGKKSRKDKNGGMFASHPPSAERMTTLKALAEKQGLPEGASLRREDYRKALSPFWADFVDDQIKLNDFGATEFLLGDLAREGWTSDLLYARGELYRSRGQAADLPKAAESYRQSIAGGTAPVEAWRGLGLALLRAGSATEGKAALKDYLGKRPDAPDKAMIAMMAGG